MTRQSVGGEAQERYGYKGKKEKAKQIRIGRQVGDADNSLDWRRGDGDRKQENKSLGHDATYQGERGQEAIRQDRKYTSRWDAPEDVWGTKPETGEDPSGETHMFKGKITPLKKIGNQGGPICR